MWNDIQTYEGYLGLQEVLRNGHEAFKDRAFPGPVPYAQIPELAERGRKRAEVYFDRLEARLEASPFIASARFTYADIVGYVYLGFAVRALGHDPATNRPALKRWSETVAARPGIKASG